MISSVMVLALSGCCGLADKMEVACWLSDYNKASEQGKTEKKPLAIFIASGKDGWKKLARDGKLGMDIEHLLMDGYVCVYLDTETKEGKRLAAAFEMPKGLGIVISDKTGKLQAFRHEGDLANNVLVRYLKQFADPTRVVVATITNPGDHDGHNMAPTGSGTGHATQSVGIMNLGSVAPASGGSCCRGR